MNLKIGITVIVLININLSIHAQNTFPTSGNVGIGTTNPAASLQVHINGNQRAFRIKNDLNNAQFNFWTTEASGNKQLRIDEDTNGGNVATFLQNGTIGFGTTTPFSGTSNTGLHINKGTHSSVLLGDPTSGFGGIMQTSDARQRVFIGANLYDDQSGSWKSFQSGKGSAGISIIADEGDWGTEITFITSQSDDHYSRSMKILGNGNVGIGINNPDSKLVVDGRIRSEEVKVEIISGPDYVFEPDYELRTLQETKEFITTNKHLPEIPSANEMEVNGIDLGDMNMRLLKKIEELTLYQIELMEEMEAMKKELQELKSNEYNKH